MPLNINFQQIFLHLFNFTILFGALYFLLYKPVQDFMAKRDAHYAELDRQAQEKLSQAEELRLQYEKRLAAAGEEIQGKCDQALQSAMDTAQQQLLQVQTEASHIMASARAEAQAERERILREARGEISEMLTLAAEKLLSTDTSAAYDQFLNAAGRSGEDG